MKKATLFGILFLTGLGLQAPRAQDGDSFLYIVRKNDTLTSISERLYGSRKFALQILRMNPGLDTRQIRPGLEIRVPTEARDEEDDWTRVLQGIREKLQRAEQAQDAEAARHALDELEKAIMEARRVSWETEKVGAVSPVPRFFQVLSAPF